MQKLLFLFFLAVSLRSEVPGPIPDWVSVDWNIQFDKYPETKLDVFQSKRATDTKPRPAVINIHGGGWLGRAYGNIFERMIRPYLERGWVVVNIEYRLAETATAPAAVMDTLAAVKWVRDNAKRYNIDTSKLIAAGSSAGGHLSLMAGMTPESAKLGPAANLAAVVNFCGITDVADLLAGPHQQRYAVEWLPEQKDRLRIAALVSPLTYVRKGLPPILTLHGSADTAVPYEQGVRLTNALQKVGARTEMITVPNGPHRFRDQKLVELYPRIFKFLKRYGIE